jgi:hypothetical protein
VNLNPDQWFVKTSSPALKKDIVEASEFIQAFYGPIADVRTSFMCWKIEKGPYGLGVLSMAKLPTSGKIVSTCSITPRRLWFQNTKILSGQIGDTFTAELYQRKGLFVDLVRSSCSKAESIGIRCVFGFPNSNSYPGYVNKLGFIEIQGLQLYTFTAIMNWKSIEKNSKIASSRVFQLLFGSKILSSLVGLLIRAWREIVKLLLTPSKIYDIRQEVYLTNEFNDFWQRMENHLPTAIIRDSTYLNWRFLENPYPYKIWIIRKRHKIVGYFVTLTVFSEKMPLVKRSILADWLYDPNEGSKIRRYLLHSALNCPDFKDSEFITSLHSAESSQKLPFWAAGFFRRKIKRPVIVFGNFEGRTLSKSRIDWHLTSSDLDEF